MTIEKILLYLDELGLSYEFKGNKQDVVEGFSSLKNYKPRTFTWVKKQIDDDLGNLEQFALVFIAEDVQGEFKNQIKTKESKRAFFSTIEHFYGQEEEGLDVGYHTYISPKVKIGENVKIGHGCVIDGEITIGNNTTIWNNVTIIHKVSIGNYCEIQSGTVIGHDGYAYTESDHRMKKMVKHFGGVSIEDNVHLGMNTIIARGVIDDTKIKKGCKIDSLNFIAHNCIVHENVSMVVGNNIYGSSEIKENAYLAGGVLVRNQCVVGNDALVGMGSVVVKDVKEDSIVMGNPAKEKDN